MKIDLRLVKEWGKEQKVLAGAAVLALVLILLVAWDLVNSYQAFSLVKNSQAEAGTVVQLVKERKWAELPVALSQIQESTRLAVKKLNRVTILSWSKRLQASKISLSLVDTLLRTGQDLALALRDNNPQSYQAVRLVLIKNDQLLAEALRTIDQLGEQLDIMSGGQSAAQVASLVDNKLTAEQISNLKPWLKLLPTLVNKQPETYLVLLTGSDELRATGGVLTSYAVVSIKDGQVSRKVVEDIKALDQRASIRGVRVAAPELYSRYFSQRYWSLGNANWLPDYPTAARTVLDLYRQESGDRQSIDGVLTVTPELLRRVLAVTGPVEARGVIYDAALPAVELEYRLGVNGRLKTDALVNNMLDGLLSYGLTDWAKVASALTDGLNRKEGLLYFLDDTKQAAIYDLNWAGAIAPSNGDYLLVVDSNVQAPKMDADVDKLVDYTVTDDQSGYLLGTLKLSYRQRPDVHPWPSSPYRSFTRVYAPVGSKFVEATVDGQVMPRVESVLELGKQVYGFAFRLSPGVTKEFVVRYQLPIKSNASRYQLLYQRQAGRVTKETKVNFRIFGQSKDFTLPGDQDQFITVDN